MPSSSPIQPPTPSETITIQFKGPSVKGQLYMPDVMLSGDPKDLFARLRIVEDEGKTGPRPEPLREQEPPPAPDSAKEKRREYRTAPNPKAVSILVVDDSEANRDIMGRMLALRGYEPEFAASGEEALARSTSKDFAIIFMDCFMPGMDGLKASKLIRSSKASAKTKIVGMSAKVGTQELERCRASGMNELLSKPFTLSQLTAMIQSLTAGGERAGGMHR
jgi:FOG: CheY-like receiver